MNEITILSDWSFWMTSYEEATSEGEAFRLPGSMDENKKGINNIKEVSVHHLNRDYLYVGPATYKREIEIPAEWKGKQVFLYLERSKKTRVWLDGTRVGDQQKSLTTPHIYDLTEVCKFGHKQILAIEVDNSFHGLPLALGATFVEGEPWSHQVTEHTQTNWNGIIGKIRLYAEDTTYISEIQIRPDIENHIAKTKITVSRAMTDSTICGKLMLSARSFNSEEPVHMAELQSIDFDMSVGQKDVQISVNYDMGEDFLLWDEFCPALYHMEVSLAIEKQDGILESKSTQEFGMRSFTVGSGVKKGKQFLINNRPTILRGEINCALFPQKGYCPMDLESWMSVYQVYKDYGINHVRFHTWVPPEAAFMAADRLGMYVYTELPHWGRKMFGNVFQGDYSDVDYYKEEAKRIFKAYCNFPSFVMFALGNEERIGFYYYEEFLQYCKELESELLYSDIAGHSTYPASADFAAKYIYPDYLPQITDGNNWDFTKAVEEAPMPITGHEVGQFQVYPDYAKELPKYNLSVLKPRNLMHFQEILAKAGLLEEAEKFNRATGGLSGVLTRYFVEAYLRTNGAGGFTLLGLQDFGGQGTALIGLLDAFLESKGIIEPEVFRQSCAALTVLAKMKKFVWEVGECFEAEILVSNYDRNDLETAIYWSLESEKEVLGRGEISRCIAKQGEVTTFGKVSIPLPMVARAEKLMLKLSLSEAIEDVYSPGINDYEIWLFPEEEEVIKPEEIVLCRIYDDKAEEALAMGKKVLLISEGTAESLPLSRAVTFRPDFWSPMFHKSSPDGYSLGLCIEKENPLFRDFPTDDFANCQWLSVLEDARGVLINGAPVSLKPMVQAIATMDLAERLAVMFEARIEKGSIFVCSIDLLKKKDIASRNLLKSIYRYMSSDAFVPETVWESEELKKRLTPQEQVHIPSQREIELGMREQMQATQVLIDGVQCFASSEMEGYSVENLANDQVSGGWVSDYKNRNICMPQFVTLALPHETKLNCVLCCAPEDHPRGTILEASIEISSDGIEYKTVCSREWSENTDSADRFFVFEAIKTSYIRLNIERSVMFTGDTNAVAIDKIKLYQSNCVASVENPDICEVRYGISFEEMERRKLLPEQIAIQKTDGTKEMAEVLWDAEGYQAEVAADYLLYGKLFTQETANPGKVKACQVIRVLPKNTTIPPDKSQLDILLNKIRNIQKDQYELKEWEDMQIMLERAIAFNAMTGAVQHDVDVWEDELHMYLTGVI